LGLRELLLARLLRLRLPARMRPCMDRLLEMPPVKSLVEAEAEEISHWRDRAFA
jgi:hypothetical protein